MNEIIMLKGLPGSGKSTWAKEFCLRNKEYVRINRDDLRNMRGQYWLPKDEDMITDWELSLIDLAFRNGKKVVLDATNLAVNAEHKLATEMLGRGHKPVHVTTQSFLNVSVDECIKRDMQRPNSVGETVIRRMHEQHICHPAVYYESKDLPKAVIVDIDGTLAKMNGRGPFEWSKVDTDLVNCNVVNLVNTLHDIKTIILMSGRDGSCCELTEKWLADKGIKYDYLFMRPAGNSEKDSIIKKRLFEENIRGKYYIDFVLDDRDQVVRMWRKELGLTCLQVDYGAF